MLKIAICDDNIDSIKCIAKMLESEIIEQKLDAEISIITSSQDKIRELIINKEIDFLILDVEFDNSTLNGIEFATELRKYNNDFYLVFLSAHQRFLHLALVTKIFDYIVKPANRESLKLLVKRMKAEFEGNTNLFINISKWQSLRTSEIICMEKHINKTIITTTYGSFSCTKTLDKLLKILPVNFKKCHRSFIINMNKVLCINSKEKNVYLENGILCPINDSFCEQK